MVAVAAVVAVADTDVVAVQPAAVVNHIPVDNQVDSPDVAVCCLSNVLSPFHEMGVYHIHDVAAVDSIPCVAADKPSDAAVDQTLQMTVVAAVCCQPL